MAKFTLPKNSKIKKGANFPFKGKSINKKEFKITDLIKYSISLYRDQGFNFPNQKVQEELSTFLIERLKFYMKQKDIRYDIVEASIDSFSIDQASQMYSKALALNKVILKDIGNDIILSYKRASNILENELKNKDLDLLDGWPEQVKTMQNKTKTNPSPENEM